MPGAGDYAIHEYGRMVRLNRRGGGFGRQLEVKYASVVSESVDPKPSWDGSTSYGYENGGIGLTCLVA